MLLRWCTLALLLLLLAGCAALEGMKPKTDSAPAAFDSPGQAIGEAEAAAARGEWRAALDLLERAAARFPRDAGLQRRRQRMVIEWEHWKRTLEDRLLAGDAENQQRKIELLDALVRAEPDDLLWVSRRFYWKEVLADKLAPLVACSEYHVEREPALAERCHAVALALPADDAARQRLLAVAERLRANERAAVKKRRDAQVQERRRRTGALLQQARDAIAAREYRRALDLLGEVERLQPGHRDLPELRAAAWDMIAPQLEALVKLGDQLYLEGQLEAAVATWQAALGLKPGDEEIGARIERARTVLQRLEALRQQQQREPERDAASGARPAVDGAEVGQPAAGGG